MNTIRPLFVSTYPPEECGLATFAEIRPTRWIWRREESVSSFAAIHKVGKLYYGDPR